MSSILNDLKSTFQRKDQALMQIILINVIIFLIMNLFKSLTPGIFGFLLPKLAIPSHVGIFLLNFWTVFTYMFLHLGLGHIFFNMLILYFLGRIFNDYLGHKKLVSTFIIGGLAGGVLYLLVYNLVPSLRELPQSYLLGASAGIMAIVVGIATLVPNLTLHLFLFGPVRLKYIALALFIITSIYELRDNTGGKIAHMGGALWGYLYVTEYRKGRDIASWFNNSVQYVTRLFTKKPVSRMHVAHKKTKSDEEYRAKKAASQQQIDDILDKISKSGYESLSAEEKSILFNFSNENKENR